MRTNEERLAAMHSRAAELTKQKKMKQSLFAGAASIAGCLAVLILLAFQMPRVSEILPGSPAPGGMTASIFSGNAALSYIVIGIVAFLLGVSVTIFCFRLKKWQDSRTDEDRL